MKNVNNTHLKSGTKEINNLALEDKIKWKVRQSRISLIKCYKDKQKNPITFTMVLMRIVSLKQKSESS